MLAKCFQSHESQPGRGLKGLEGGLREVKRELKKGLKELEGLRGV